MATGAERDVSARDARMERQEAVDAWVSRCVTPLGGSAHGRPEAWFLGPKAENVAVLRDLVVKALDDHAAYRLAFHREDPERITPRVKGSSEYQAGIAQLTDETSNLLRCLRGSVPFFSMRYPGHMLWNQALPAMVGYFAAMLYNQNNVAAEASPVTTRMEIEVGDELCKMLGYGERDGVSPWGHITAGGSVANIESLWAARNAKFFAFALRSALKGDVRMENAKALEVRRLDGTSEQLVNLDAWTCLNLRIDDVIALPKSIEERFGISVETTKAALAEHALENRGLVDFYSRLRAEDPTIRLPIVLAPATRHYSWPKAMTLLGVGDA